MPSILIHLAIANQYCKLHPEENIKEFMLGSTLPDSTKNKNLTHYGSNNRDMLYFDYVKNKVNLNTVVKYIELNSSLNRAMFLHLLADYAFYNDKKIRQNPNKIEQMPLKETSKLSNIDYYILNQKMIEKYNVDLKFVPPYLKKYTELREYKPLCFYNENEVYKFIETISKINLEKVYDDIKNGIINFYNIKF